MPRSFERGLPMMRAARTGNVQINWQVCRPLSALRGAWTSRTRRQAPVGRSGGMMDAMRRLLVPSLIVGIGTASIAVALSAQSCVVWLDGRACATVGTIALNVLGLAMIGIGGLWLFARVRRGT